MGERILTGLRLVGDPDQGLGLLEGERCEDEGLHDTEDGRRRSNTEPDDHRREEGESGCPTEGSEGIGSVLEQGAES